jgi:hypothetical protein
VFFVLLVNPDSFWSVWMLSGQFWWLRVDGKARFSIFLFG